MKIEDFDSFTFVEVFHGCEIKCPECNEFSSHEDWTELDVYCELCGGHISICCPNCKECFDNITTDENIIFETRKHKAMTAPTEPKSRFKTIAYFVRFCKQMGLNPKEKKSLITFKQF